MTIYEIDQRILALADPDTGEIMDDSAFDSLLMERDEKIEGVALWHKELVAEAKAIKEEIDKLTERKRIVERKAGRTLNYLESALNGERFSSPRVDIRYRSTSSLSVQDARTAAQWLEDAGHQDMVTYDMPKLDKRAVANLVKEGEQVPGVELIRRQSMTVR